MTGLSDRIIRVLEEVVSQIPAGVRHPTIIFPTRAYREEFAPVRYAQTVQVGGRTLEVRSNVGSVPDQLTVCWYDRTGRTDIHMWIPQQDDLDETAHRLYDLMRRNGWSPGHTEDAVAKLPDLSQVQTEVYVQLIKDGTHWVTAAELARTLVEDL